MLGTVKQYNNRKGFGFIQPDNPGPEVFFLYTEILGDRFKNLQAGARVEFELTEGFRNPWAKNIKEVKV